MINDFANISEQLNKHDLYSLYQSYGYFNDDRMMMLPGLPHLLNSYPMHMSMMAHNAHFNDICMPRQSIDHEQHNTKKAVGVVKSQLKKKWNPLEDRILKTVVCRYGTANWTYVSSLLPGRTGKQCRERWLNHLSDGIKKGEWSEEEDRRITTMRLAIGNQWSKITKMLPGRTDNAVKNRFHAMERAMASGKMQIPDFYDHSYFLHLVSCFPELDIDLVSNPHPPTYDITLPHRHTRHMYTTSMPPASLLHFEELAKMKENLEA